MRGGCNVANDCGRILFVKSMFVYLISLDVFREVGYAKDNFGGGGRDVLGGT